MSCFDKMKSLATRKGISQKEISTYFEMPYNSFNNKMHDCDTRFNFKDLINYAEILGFKIAVVDENEKIIEAFDINDLKKQDVQ